MKHESNARFRSLAGIMLLIFAFCGAEATPVARMDCETIETPAAQLDCHRQAYVRSDAKLNRVYNDIKDSLPEAVRAELVEDERMWIGYKEYVCEWQSEVANDEIQKWNCLTDFTTSRISYLERAYGGLGVEDGFAGEYSDGLGGLLVVKQTNDRYKFDLTVVRGPTYHIGEVHGVLPEDAQEMTAWHIDENCSEEDRLCCELNFQYAERRIIIEEIDCSSYHGARAYFDGIYRKVK